MKFIDTVNIGLIDGGEARDFDIDFAVGGHHYRYPHIPESQIWLEDGLEGKDLVANACHELIERILEKFLELGYEESHEIATAAEKIIRQKAEQYLE